MIRLMGALALSLWASVALAQDASRLETLDWRGDLLGWEAVGRVDMPNGFCTGTLIASDLVLTAGHCIHSDDGERYDASRIVFRAGYAHGKSIAERRVVAYAVPDEYRVAPGRQRQIDAVAHDVALLRLESPISTSMADPFRIYDTSREGDVVTVVSYGMGREEAPSRQRECHLLDSLPNGLMLFNCQIIFGSSGAPVLARYGNRFRIVSVISGGQNMGTDDVIAVGMSLPDVVSDLRSELRGGGGLATNRPSQGARRLVVGQRNSQTGARFVRP